MELRGRVAVVTGAASGIGFALAERFGEQGMRVVMADVEAPALQDAAQELEKQGVEVLAVPTDVSRADQVSALAERTLATFGGVHVVCNNARVLTGGLSWEAPLEDYEWVLGVNLWGVIHGIRSFVPIMLERGEQGHIVNTASMAAVTSMPYSATYFLSNHAVLSLSESLYHELTLRGARIGVSALCPGAVVTRLDRSERNRPDHLSRTAEEAPNRHREMFQISLDKVKERGVPPAHVADRVIDAIRDRRFYVLWDGEWMRSCETRLEDIRLGRNPTFVQPFED